MKFARAPMTRAAIALAALALLGLIPAEASASQEVGSTCVANRTLPNTTALVLYTNGALHPQPNVIPAGVITRWKVQAPAGQAPIAQQLVVNRQVGEQDDSKVGESALETVVPGLNEFATRVPAPEYAHVGLTGPDGALYCEHVDMDTAGLVEGPWAVGETRHFGVAVNASVPVVAVVEPDRDNDGYGDETQDLCPQSAALSGRLSARSPQTSLARAKPGAILLDVTPSAEAKIYAWGQVGWRVDSKGGREQPASHRRPRPDEIHLGPGRRGRRRIKLPLPKAVIRRLNLMPPSGIPAGEALRPLDGPRRTSVHREAHRSSSGGRNGQLSRGS